MPQIIDLQAADPRWIGDYQVVGRLGAGSQGVVYLATTPSGDRVAIKQLLSGVEDGQAREQFAKEVAAARLVAPFCTAQLIDVQLEGPAPYLVSEYIEGPSLHQKITQDGPMSGTTLQRLAIGTVTALAAIHEAGVVHRDFKPANVMLSPEGPRVIDFGIARDLSIETTLTARVFGTPAFMSPEQLENEQVGPAADMFAWASVITYAATGQSPFDADHMMAIAYRITTGEPTLAGVPAELMTVIGYCLSKDPARRPTAQQALALLLGRPESDYEPGEPAGPVDPAQLLLQGSRVATAATLMPQPRPMPPAAQPRRRLDGGRVAFAGVLILVLATGIWGVVTQGGLFDRSPSEAKSDLSTGTPSDSPTAVSSPVVTPQTDAASTGPIEPTKKKVPAKEPKPISRTTRAAASVPTSKVVKSATGTGVIVGITGKCLDIVNAQGNNGNTVQIWDCNDTKAQIWTAGKDGTIQALGKCLNVAGGVVEINACDGTSDQKWRIASGIIVNTGSKACLATLAGDSADRTPVVVNSCNGGKSQAWSLRS